MRSKATFASISNAINNRSFTTPITQEVFYLLSKSEKKEPTLLEHTKKILAPFDPLVWLTIIISWFVIGILYALFEIKAAWELTYFDVETPVSPSGDARTAPADSILSRDDDDGDKGRPSKARKLLKRFCNRSYVAAMEMAGHSVSYEGTDKVRRSG